MRAILRLGKTCAPDEAGLTLTRAQVTGLDLHQLDRGSPSMRSRYLDGGRGGKYLFLYHANAPSAPVHVFALFTHDGAVRIHIVDPASQRQPIPRLRELYAELLARHTSRHGESASIAYPAHAEFTPTYHATDATAAKRVRRDIGRAMLHHAGRGIYIGEDAATRARNRSGRQQG